jgi:hypothetical protein
MESNKCKLELCNKYDDFEIICCPELKERLNNCKIGILYDKACRFFSIKRPHPYKSGAHRIPHCPWCGKQFPKDLIDEWYGILEKEYGLDYPDGDSQSKLVPEEFKTDEWWKKRGL